ncbi:alpha/beta hydrolase family protein [Luteimonas granuli]|uniref:Alpha/beta fold hydrolase n=1 Tax=Luteimonas granuli TaxID=1176533 RepID=A0A518N409_9GAMM|nr:alpha/beta hydrolase [Luteimonas granuli]QDW66652.1 alpha/beta fold hydrolase [Luteimonas granuli]
MHRTTSRRLCFLLPCLLPLAAVAAQPDWPQPARRIVDPESGQPYRLERVFVPSGPHRIAATLLRPDDDARVPVLVSVSGSRDGISPAEGPLQRRLVRRGMAVLTLGKKGVGASTGDWRKEDFADRADNVRAALDWVAARPDLDGSRSVLYGHSQGGYVVPLVADDPRVAALILAAGPAEPVHAQIASERFETLRRNGTPEARARAGARRQARWLRALLSGCGLVPYHYLCRVYRHDPVPALSAVRQPVLALLGENDPLVPPAANLAPMQAALAANPGAEIRVLERSNHLFWESTSGLPEEYPRLLQDDAPFPHADADDPDHERLRRWPYNRARFAPGYFEAIERFLERHLILARAPTDATP